MGLSRSQGKIPVRFLPKLMPFSAGSCRLVQPEHKRDTRRNIGYCWPVACLEKCRHRNRFSAATRSPLLSVAALILCQALPYRRRCLQGRVIPIRPRRLYPLKFAPRGNEASKRVKLLFAELSLGADGRGPMQASRHCLVSRSKKLRLVSTNSILGKRYPA
jgi:hypothetical protein